MLQYYYVCEVCTKYFILYFSLLLKFIETFCVCIKYKWIEENMLNVAIKKPKNKLRSQNHILAIIRVSHLPSNFLINDTKKNSIWYNTHNNKSKQKCWFIQINSLFIHKVAILHFFIFSCVCRVLSFSLLFGKKFCHSPN